MSRPVVYLHIGAMKTGTTYLQHRFLTNRDRLAGAGHHFAGESWSKQVRAAQDLLGLDQHDPHIAAQSAGAWDALVAEMLARRTGSSVISMEFLSFARRRQVARVARDLVDAEVHVVLTARDVTAAIPAQWQTSVTSGSTHTWSEFQLDVQRSAGPLWAARALRGDSGVREFRRTQNIEHMVRTWGRIVAPERLHVVLVPAVRRDDDELWRRFCTAIGADHALATAPATATNPSLGHASTELVRRLNVALTGTLPWDYNHTVKSPLGTKVLAGRRHDELRARLDPATVAFAGDWNARTRAALVGTGVRVIGDLEVDLPVDGGVAPGPGSSEPTEDDVLAAAEHLHGGLVELIARRQRRLARATEEPVSELQARDGSVSTMSASIDDLATLSREAMRLRRELLDAEDD